MPESSDRSRALAVAGILVLAMVALYSMGRTPWGTAGGPGLWTADPASKLTSQLLTDPYTFTHVNHGLVFFLVLWATTGAWLEVGDRLVVTAVLESCWEIVENTPTVIERFREATIALGYYGDSILNSTGDILACLLGFWIASRLRNKWWVVGLFVALEVGLALWIRDNMTLNLLMLIHPVPAVRQWQGG
ncbi:MAG: DUF2585 family protein [Bradymonadaceae bacterium]